ncbi:MAG TPA: hypothetical protein PK867_05010 [Pirellulales bacterium]|nr:hypothetical protein [Pirellulales bacterium]
MPPITQIGAQPGIGTTQDALYRRVLWTADQKRLVPGGRVLSGVASRDPFNTTDVTCIQGGTLLGKISSVVTAGETVGHYAPSILGQVAIAFNGSTSLKLFTAAQATELVRRCGASGTFNLIGPPTAGGTVRTLLATYSAVGTGGTANEVQTLTPDAAATGGTYTITLPKPDGTFATTAPLAYNATLAAAQAAVTLALGAVAGWVLSSAGSAAPWSAGPIAVVFTASGTGYTAQDFPMITVDISQLTGVTTITGVETTKGLPAATTVTVTALNVNEVQTITFGAAMTAGTLAIVVPAADGSWQRVATAWNTTWAQTMADWNTKVTAILGVAGIVMTGTATVPVLTFSGTGYAALAQPLCQVDPSSATGPTSSTIVRTTAGQDGRFIAGSLVCPTDGSQTPIAVLGKEDGVNVVDRFGASYSAAIGELLVGGALYTASIPGYLGIGTAPSVPGAGADASIQSWIKAGLQAASPNWMFDDTF